MEDTFTLEDLKTANATRYDDVKAYGKTVVIGSVNSEDMIEWIESNGDEKTKREAGLRLLVKSVVEVVKRGEDGSILEVKRIPKDQREAYMALFRQKDARENGRVVGACLRLNGLDIAAKKIEALKNESSEASPAASPIDSPSQSGE